MPAMVLALMYSCRAVGRRGGLLVPAHHGTNHLLYRGHGPLLPKNRTFSVCSRPWVALSSPVPTEMVGTCGWSGPCPRNNRIKPKSHSSTDTPPSVAPTRPGADWPAHTGRPGAHPPGRAGHDRETPAATMGHVCHEAMDLTAAGRFEPVDHPAQVALLPHLHQPVDMIRHQHPGQHAGLTEQGTVLETPAGGAGGPEIEEDRLPLPGGGGHQVHLVRQGHPAPAQGSLPRFVVSMGVVAVGHRVLWGIVGGFAGVGFAGMARSYSPGGWRRGMLAMVLPSGVPPAPLVIAAGCSCPSTIALTPSCFAGMARSYRNIRRLR